MILEIIVLRMSRSFHFSFSSRKTCLASQTGSFQWLGLSPLQTCSEQEQPAHLRAILLSLTKALEHLQLLKGKKGSSIFKVNTEIFAHFEILLPGEPQRLFPPALFPVGSNSLMLLSSFSGRMYHNVYEEIHFLT